MMRFSPCAWYCYELPGMEGDWEVTDTTEKTVITATDGSCSIEIVAARKAAKAEDMEISDLHEVFLKGEGVHALRTVMTTNSYRVTTLVTRGIGANQSTNLVCHAFWSNYCAFIRFLGDPEAGAERRMQTFYTIVHSLQPLVSE